MKARRTAVQVTGRLPPAALAHDRGARRVPNALPQSIPIAIEDLGGGVWRARCECGWTHVYPARNGAADGAATHAHGPRQDNTGTESEAPVAQQGAPAPSKMITSRTAGRRRRSKELSPAAQREALRTGQWTVWVGSDRLSGWRVSCDLCGWTQSGIANKRRARAVAEAHAGPHRRAKPRRSEK